MFKIAHALTNTPYAVKLAVSSTLQEFNDDGVVYLELRSTPRSNAQMTKSEYVQAMIDAVMLVFNFFIIESLHITLFEFFNISGKLRRPSK